MMNASRNDEPSQNTGSAVGSSGAYHNNMTASNEIENPIAKALEWSLREAEERKLREQQEEEELQKILALSLIEK